MQPDVRTPQGEGFDPALVKKIRWAVIGAIVVGVAVVVYFLIRAVDEEKAQARWDDLARIQEQFEPDIQGMRGDPLFEDPAGIYGERRDRYAKALEAFLPEAGTVDDALAPHVHFLLAKIYSDQFYSSLDPLAPEVREKFFGLAKKHLEILRDDYPDFQGNWQEFAPSGHSSVVRMMLANLEANRSWAKDNFPGEKAPSDETQVVLRTTAGDMKMGLYPDDAPELVKLFLERVRRGEYDGTYFFARTDEGSDTDPVRKTIRGGNPSVRDVAPFDAKAAVRFADASSRRALMPAPARYRIAVTRGVVAAWHEKDDRYDGAMQVLVAVARSPQMDYAFTPFARLLDEPSRATADRIFARDSWGAATSASPPDEIATIRAFLRAPVKIVKALAYRGGHLLEPEGAPVPTRAKIDVSEDSMDDLVPDAYREEAPTPPAETPPGGDDDEKPAGSDAAGPDEGAGTQETPGEGEGSQDASGTPPEEHPDEPKDAPAPEDGAGR